MEFGLFLSGQDPPESDPHSLAEGLLAQTRAARDAGFDLVSMGQHYLNTYHQLQVIPMLGRLAADAGSMQISSGIVLLPLHHPVEIAEQFATLNLLAEGVVVGVGAGYRDEEFENFGIPKHERAGRLAEGVELMNRLWTETNVTYNGEFYQTTDATINPRPAEKPPVWIAANTRPAIERAARIGDAWYVNPHATITEIKAHKHAYDAIRHDRGEPTGLPVFREAFVAPTTEAAVETARNYLEAKYQMYTRWGQDEAMEDQDDLHRPFDELAQDRFLLGTPAEVCAEIERYEAELDASHMLMRVRWPGLPFEDACECITRIGDDVIPNL